MGGTVTGATVTGATDGTVTGGTVTGGSVTGDSVPGARVTGGSAAGVPDEAGTVGGTPTGSDVPVEVDRTGLDPDGGWEGAGRAATPPVTGETAVLAPLVAPPCEAPGAGVRLVVVRVTIAN